jgi:hypothetical protein
MPLLLGLCLVLSSPAEADAQMTSSRRNGSQIGFTAGVSIDPEQAVGGVFWRTPEIGGRFHLRPGIEGGFGSDLRLATVNIDFIARFPLGASGWDFVQGGGPAIVITTFDSAAGRSRDLGAGGSYVVGFAHDSGFLGEFRIGGGGNVPSLKMSAGFALSF